jgi:hypothetical protein
MAISITRHNLGARDYIGEQLSDSVTVADGAASSALSAGLYRIAATSNSLVRVGPGLTNGSGGFYMAAGTTEAVRVPEGFVVGCSAG